MKNEKASGPPGERYCVLLSTLALIIIFCHFHQNPSTCLKIRSCSASLLHHRLLVLSLAFSPWTSNKSSIYMYMYVSMSYRTRQTITRSRLYMIGRHCENIWHYEERRSNNIYHGNPLKLYIQINGNIIETKLPKDAFAL